MSDFGHRRDPIAKVNSIHNLVSSVLGGTKLIIPQLHRHLYPPLLGPRLASRSPWFFFFATTWLTVPPPQSVGVSDDLFIISESICHEGRRG